MVTISLLPLKSLALLKIPETIVVPVAVPLLPYEDESAIVEPDTSSRYTPNLNTKAKRALYDNLNQNEVLALALDEMIIKTKKADWRGNLQKEREIKKAILSVVKTENEVERIFELVKNQSEY